MRKLAIGLTLAISTLGAASCSSDSKSSSSTEAASTEVSAATADSGVADSTAATTAGSTADTTAGSTAGSAAAGGALDSHQQAALDNTVTVIAAKGYTLDVACATAVYAALDDADADIAAGVSHADPSAAGTASSQELAKCISVGGATATTA
ncbi:MAG: hypothetical protein JWM34_3471 [Ilumatobacteraceae bacterium]|nr:hypothetical protein [Ilumatobacteraceae bacterium]